VCCIIIGVAHWYIIYDLPVAVHQCSDAAVSIEQAVGEVGSMAQVWLARQHASPGVYRKARQLCLTSLHTQLSFIFIFCRIPNQSGTCQSLPWRTVHPMGWTTCACITSSTPARRPKVGGGGECSNQLSLELFYLCVCACVWGGGDGHVHMQGCKVVILGLWMFFEGMGLVLTKVTCSPTKVIQGSSCRGSLLIGLYRRKPCRLFISQ
jgi:hypothetical protein